MQCGMPTLIELNNVEECVKLCKELQLDFIELNMNFPQYQLERIDEEYFKRLIQQNNIYYTIHLEEEFNACGYNKLVTEAYLQTMTETIKLAKKLGAPVLNMHMSEGIYITLPQQKIYLYRHYKDLYLTKLREFRDICAQEIGDSDIRICIENSSGYSDFTKEGIELLLESRIFALTFDIGHDHSHNGVDEPFIRAHKNHLIHMHLHDAIGTQNHLAIGAGEIDINNKLKLAKECNCRCVLETKTITGLKESVLQLRGKYRYEESYL
jgi:sugar phosphate isomerase/epimerase